MSQTSQERVPLDSGRLAAGLPAGWQVSVVDETESTNADLLAAAEANAPEGTVLVAEFQHAGRGRLNRSWTSPRGAGLTVSVLLRPRVDRFRWPWLPLLTGVSLATAIHRSAPEVTARLKWPNDLLLGPDLKKAAGILAQLGSGAVVVGIGLNVTTTVEELGLPTATSLALQGSPTTDRTGLLLGILAELAGGYARWQAADGDATASGLAASYRELSATIGSRVSVELAASTLIGQASDIDAEGRLVLAHDGTQTAVAAGDVTHLRPESNPAPK
jgi:BirA family transcriptional regulator, biotin operon repressor / biotin---[acetyl-CoA-carboxylase] ligase